VFDPDAKVPDLLNRNLKRSLERDAEILELPFDVDDPKTNSLIVATSTATKTVAVKVDQNRLMAERQPEALERVLARISSLVQEKQVAAQTPIVDVTPAATILEEPPRQADFTEFHRIKGTQEPEQLQAAPETALARQRYLRTGIRPPSEHAPFPPRAPSPKPADPSEPQAVSDAATEALGFKFTR
jgi:hypothetical protein